MEEAVRRREASLEAVAAVLGEGQGPDGSPKNRDEDHWHQAGRTRPLALWWQQ